MQIQQLNRSDGESVKIVVQNVAGQSLTTGLGVSYIGAAASIDGVGVSLAILGTSEGFCGVADSDIPTDGFGLATVWGLAQSVHISHVGTSLTVTKGDILKPGAVAGTFFSSLTDQAASTLMYRYIIAATTPVAVSTKAQSYVKGIVRAL